MIRRYLQKKMKAYFTVEAAMVLTLVTGMLTLLVYIIFFQYNRCLLEMDIGALALKGCSVQSENKDDLLQKLNQYSAQIYKDKYLAWEHGDIILKLEENTVRIEQTGTLQFPFTGSGFFNKESEWTTMAVYVNRKVSPISFLRNYHKLTGGD